MGRKPRVDRSPEEKWQIIQEGIKSGNVSETCRRHGIAPNLFYRWKDEAEQGAKAALGGKSAAAAETEKDHRIRQLERTLGRKALEIEILKNVVGVQEYFGGMKRHLMSVKSVVAPNARCIYILGDQASYLRVHIPTADILSSLADEVGFKTLEIRHWRKRWSTTTSKELNENILVLEAPDK